MSSPAAWRARGRPIETRDGSVFVVDTGGGSGTPLIALHGFPTSSWDFERAVDLLSRDRRVVTFDFLGFGYSDKPPGLAYSLFEQADVAVAVARAVGLTRAHLWAHDMGTSVATELLARRERGALPFELASLTLMNGSVHIEMAHLTLGQRLLRTRLGPLVARASSARVFKSQLRSVFARPVPDGELDAMWELASRNGGTRLYPKIIRYTHERRDFARRWIGALERLDLPALVAWGARDPVAVIGIADRLAAEIPGAERITWSDLGHYPQLEDAPRVVSALRPFFEAHEPARS